MIAEPHCRMRKCVHYRGVVQTGNKESTERVVCCAFPDGIPEEIAYGGNLHTDPFPGDNGIRFVRKTDANAET